MTETSELYMRNIGTWGVRYPSPFFDISRQYMPVTVSSLFRWCEYYINNDALIQTVLRRMSEYPITEIQIEGSNKSETSVGENIFELLKIRSFCISCGLHFFGFGNGFTSISQRFKRYIKCTQCRTPFRLSDARVHVEFKKKENKPIWEMKKCPICGYSGEVKTKDVPLRDLKNIILIRYDPKQIEIDHNPITGETQYNYSIPKLLKRKIKSGDVFSLETTPQLFLDACILDRKVELQEDNLFHFARSSASGDSKGWGMPLIQPVLKELFQIQIAKKAREALLQQHIVPLWVLFPSPQGEGSPFQHLNLGTWRTRIEQEFKRWKRDPNYIPLMPMPLGFQYVGGDMTKLNPTALIEYMQKEIVSGMGVPIEFVFGGLTYSGSSISLRMLENQFLNFRRLLEEFLNKFLIPKLVRITKVKPFSARFTKLRMSDDVQQKQLALNLSAQGKLSDRTMLAENGFDYDTEQPALDEQFEVEDERIEKRARRRASMEADIQESMLRSQAEMNQDQAAAAGMDIPGMIDSHAETLAKMDPQGRDDVLKRLSTSMPEYYQQVMGAVNTKNINQQPMQPATIQKPARSENNPSK